MLVRISICLLVLCALCVLCGKIAPRLCVSSVPIRLSSVISEFRVFGIFRGQESKLFRISNFVHPPQWLLRRTGHSDFLIRVHPCSSVVKKNTCNFHFALVFIPKTVILNKTMKSAGTLLITATLLFSAGAQAQDAATPDAAAPDVATADAAASTSPYASIISRNMFGLLPIPVHNPADDLPPPDPPPKITPNGIMTIFGRLQALFKVADKGKPGQPAKDSSYVLAEGERQDGIEVVKINKPDAIITFNNHGTVQELPLVAAKDNTPVAEPGRGGFNPGIRPPGGMSPAERAAMRRPTGSTGGPGGGNTMGSPGSASQSPSEPTGFQNGINYINPAQPQEPGQAPAQPMTPEAAALNMEMQRYQWQKAGNPSAAIIPPPGPDMQKVIDQNNQNDGGANP
jgi:hypothetical protein